MEINSPEYLECLILEAEQIVARHNGNHNAHGSLAALKCWRWCFEEDKPHLIDWANVEALITRFRLLDKTGILKLRN